MRTGRGEGERDGKHLVRLTVLDGNAISFSRSHVNNLSGKVI